MRVRMKLVVPLTMPITRRMCSPTSDSRSGRMSGMPPATAASKSRSTPAASAAANSSAPTLASSSLLAVTTGLPRLEGGEDQLAGRLDAADDLDDHVDVRVVDHRGGVGGEHAVGQLDRALPAEAAHRDPGDLEAQPGAGRDVVAPGVDQVHERRADVAAAQQADADRRLVVHGPER